MSDGVIDLYSDTKTRPSDAMRAAMAAAEVGDEQRGEDPTVARLNARVARLLGKEDALFLPSGTMANLVSVLIHCDRGDEILCEATSHLVHFEVGGASAVGGAAINALPGRDGMFEPDTLAAAITVRHRNAPRPRLVWIEQTTNLGGGRVWPLARLQAIRRIADASGLRMHLDGARLMNAAVAHNVPPSSYGAIADSLWIDFAKGLGAPFGAVLAGSAAFVGEARRFKQMLGGGMRQAGIMAAACLYALDHNVERLAQDHARARRLAEELGDLPGIRAASAETNIVLVELDADHSDGHTLGDRLSQKGVRVGIFGAHLLRLVTHRDVGDDGIARAVAAFKAALRA